MFIDEMLYWIYIEYIEYSSVLLLLLIFFGVVFLIVDMKIFFIFLFF